MTKKSGKNMKRKVSELNTIIILYYAHEPGCSSKAGGCWQNRTFGIVEYGSRVQIGIVVGEGEI